MNDVAFKLANPPIVEAILDIDCDMPPGWQLTAVEEPARAIFQGQYPGFRTQYFQEHKFEGKTDAPPATSIRHGVSAYQFLHADQKQLVQLRVNGFSFNRLAPYGDLDELLPEIERTWKLFVQLTAPVLVKQIRLRFINRILVPMENGKVDLDQYLRIGPRLPDESEMTLSGFLNQIAARDNRTGHTINVVFTNQPVEGNRLPVVFDNCVIASAQSREPDDWDWILSTIRELRTLKNRVFKESLTTKCLTLFQKP